VSSQRHRGEQGSAVVDFVLVSVLVVALFLGVVQLGMYLYVRNTLTAAASDGARLAATVDRTPDDGVARTEEMLHGMIGGGLVESVDASETEIDGQPAIEVVIEADMPPILPGVSIGSFTVRGHGIEETP
jgi:TadE-like protein